MTDKLKQLLSLCKCGVYISVNEHRDYYETVEEHLEDDLPGVKYLDPEIRAKMIETDTIINVHFYPRTPIGFSVVYHYDLDAALDLALATFNTKDSSEDPQPSS